MISRVMGLSILREMAVAIALLAVWAGTAGAWPTGPAEDAAALTTGAAPDRATAALALAREAPERAKTALVPLLRDADPGVRLLVARWLVRHEVSAGVATAAGWVSATVPRDRNLGLSALREATALTPEARRAVERALLDGDGPTRVLAIDVLAAHPASTSGAPTSLLRALDDDEPGVRLRAVRALAATRDAKAGLALVARTTDGDRAVRNAAVEALGDLGDARAVPALLRLLADEAFEARPGAATALGRLGATSAVPTLVRLAARRPRDELARRALAALGEIATPEALAALAAAAREPTGGDDVRVAFALAGPRAFATLTHELAVGSATSVARAADALGALGDPRAVPDLVEVAARHDGASTAALAALARFD
ncbi:MAG TPA: HEAT repeat domain-containing protein, partial [Polyangia bacterium]|nr:HEAT repeat domain-containing protein [Polyangia bacterium]